MGAHTYVETKARARASPVLDHVTAEISTTVREAGGGDLDCGLCETHREPESQLGASGVRVYFIFARSLYSKRGEVGGKYGIQSPCRKN